MPQTLFEGRIELRLPVGVAPPIEEAPGRLVVRDQPAPCAGARIIGSIMVIELLADDPSVPISVVRDQLFDVLALPDGSLISTSEEDDLARRMTCVIRIPPHPSQGRLHATRMLLALRGGAGRIYVLTFESSAEPFDALLPSFTASLDSLRISD